MDLTKIDKPFVELDDAIKGALDGAIIYAFNQFIVGGV